MTEAQPKESYREKLARILAQPQLLETVCNHLANGGSHIELCHEWDIRYSDLANWLNHKDRQPRYIQALNDRGEWVKETLLNELRALALSDLRQAFDERGKLRPMNEIPKEVARALSSIEIFEEFDGTGDARTYVGETKKIKLWNKPQAIELLMKQMGLLIERHKFEIPTKLEDLLEASRTKETTPSTPPEATEQSIKTTGEGQSL